MTFEGALAALAEPQDAAPAAAMRWLDRHWDAAGPTLVTLCTAFLDGAETPGFDDRAFFFALHLCAARGETRLHAPLCGLLLDGEATDELLGDAVTETLRGLLISTFDGDLAPMQAVVEAASSDAFAAEAALLAIAYLGWAGRLPRAGVEAYLRQVFDKIPREPDVMWVGFVTAVAALGLKALVPQVETVFAEGGVARDVMRLSDFRQDLADALADPARPIVFDALRIGPLADAVETLSAWHSFAAGPRRRAGTVLNPMRDVGRNDPCPCGSGKKFKKCCLAAA